MLNPLECYEAPTPSLDIEDIPESRKHCSAITTDIITNNLIYPLIEKYSSFNKLVNVVAYLFHFKNQCNRGWTW